MGKECATVCCRKQQRSEENAEKEIVEKLMGTFGRWHLWMCIIIFLSKFPIAWHQISIVIEGAPTDFECEDNATEKCDADCSHHVFDKSVFTETIQSQWDLVCDKDYLAQLAQTFTMLGILCGSMFFGVLSDVYGRRGPLAWAITIQVIAGVATAFSPWLWLFFIMRFLCASATGGTMVTSFVLIMELIGAKKRMCVGVIYQIPFNVGHLLLSPFGYFIRDWRYFQLTISLPSVILISYYWILPESPRWLLTIGETDKAISVIEKAAKHNRLPTTNIKEDVLAYYNENRHKSRAKGKIFDLFRTSTMTKITLVICYNWVVCGVCFYGLAALMGMLGGDIFINVAVSAAVQIPGTFLSIWMMDSMGRRWTLISANLITGLGCVAVFLIPKGVAWRADVVFGSVGMFGMSIAFPTVYIYAGELFPTVIRNIGVGAASMSCRFGSMVAPFIATLSYASALFAVFPLVGALLCFLLPETLGCKLPDTVADTEQFNKKKPREGAVTHNS